MLELAIRTFENFLKSIVPFDEEAFADAKQYFRIIILKKGEFFAESEKTCRYFGFIVSGFMRAYYYDNGIDRTTCLCNNNLFATSTTSFILQKPSQINIVATETTVILSIHHSDLNFLYGKSDFWAKVGKAIMEKEFMLADCRNRCYENLKPDENYLNLLHENPDILNRVPLQIIASYLRITPETLSRIRRRTARRIS
jgi:CRP-like cAMP-binding protein